MAKNTGKVASKGSKSNGKAAPKKKGKAAPVMWGNLTDAAREQRAEYHGAKPGELKTRSFSAAGVKITAVAERIEHGGEDQPTAVRGKVLVGKTEASKSQLLRFFGFHGFKSNDVEEFFTRLGMPVPPRNSLYSQMYDGKRIKKGLPPIRAKGETPIPAFNKKELAALKSFKDAE